MITMTWFILLCIIEFKITLAIVAIIMCPLSVVISCNNAHNIYNHSYALGSIATPNAVM